jgi:hypothetical protein
LEVYPPKASLPATQTALSRVLYPIPKSRKRGRKNESQTTLEFQDDLGLSTDKQAYQINDTIMAIRKLAGEWRLLPESRWNVTPTTQRLLKWWRKDDWPGRRPFFCQVEAVEVMIWLTEVAPGTTTGKRLLEELEAHHCYREKPADEADEEATTIADLKGDERKEAKEESEAARMWITGLETIQRKLGITRVIDLSAAPFFLRGSG